jgi:hypothetical protein
LPGALPLAGFDRHDGLLQSIGHSGLLDSFSVKVGKILRYYSGRWSRIKETVKSSKAFPKPILIFGVKSFEGNAKLRLVRLESRPQPGFGNIAPAEASTPKTCHQTKNLSFPRPILQLIPGKLY